MSSIPKSKHALRRICSVVLSKDRDDTTLEDILRVKEIFQILLESGESPKQIKERYNIKYSDFGMFLKKCLGLTIKSHTEAAINFRIKNGSRITNEKKIYKQKCQFRFNVKDYSFIPGIHLIDNLGIYHPTKNPSGLCRDHMLSVEYGWNNNIDPSIISHPANCQLITNQENISKNSGSCITLENLMKRITESNTPILEEHISVPKTDEHKKKISNSVRESIKRRKEKGLPVGRRSKVVPMVGVEPTSR